MNRYALLFFAFLSLLMTSCKDKNAVTLKEKLQSEYTRSDKVTNLSSGSKVQYMQMEKSINQQYIKELDSLVNTAFVRQLERFEDEELGVLSSYKNMFSWLFKSRQSWDDAMIVMSNKYFNSLDVSQEQHALYLEYVVAFFHRVWYNVAGYSAPSRVHFRAYTENTSQERRASFEITVRSVGQYPRPSQRRAVRHDYQDLV